MVAGYNLAKSYHHCSRGAIRIYHIVKKPLISDKTIRDDSRHQIWITQNYCQDPNFATTQPNISKVGLDEKISSHHQHPRTTTHLHKLNVSNILDVAHAILTKL